MVAAYNAIPGTPDASGHPAAFVVFAPGDGKKIFLASSLKNVGGEQNLFWGAGTLTTYLQNCITQVGVHRADGKCGEFNTLQEFYDSNTDGCAIPPGSRMVAWIKTPKQEAGSVRPPCEGPPNQRPGALPRSGCKEMFDSIGKGNLRAIESGEPTEPTGLVVVSSNGRNSRHGRPATPPPVR